MNHTSSIRGSAFTRIVTRAATLALVVGFISTSTADLARAASPAPSSPTSTSAVPSAPTVPRIYSLPYTSDLYEVKGTGAATTAAPITYDQWKAYTFPTPTKGAAAYVKYSWSDDIYAVTFWNAAESSWTWRKLTLNEWQRAGAPTPQVAGWIVGTHLHRYYTADDIFATLNGRTHKLTYDEYLAMKSPKFVTFYNWGYAQPVGSRHIYFLYDADGNRGHRIDYTEYLKADQPTPRIVGKAPRL